MGLVHTLASEYARQGITVNNVCTGYTRLDRLDDLAGKMAAQTGVVAFLASERASYANGVSLAWDGGTRRSLL